MVQILRSRRLSRLASAGIKPLAMDVTDDASMQAGVAQILKESGRVDVLVNAAGYGSYGAVEDVPLDEGRAQFEVNVFGAVRLIQTPIPICNLLASLPSSQADAR